MTLFKGVLLLKECFNVILLFLSYLIMIILTIHLAYQPRQSKMSWDPSTTADQEKVIPDSEGMRPLSGQGTDSDKHHR